MKNLIPLLLPVTLIVTGCSSAPEHRDPPPSSDTASAYDNGLPELESVDEAIAFVVEEENLTSYRGVAWGSEHYEVTLPSGAACDNWLIDCYFRDVFRPFGTDAYTKLAPLLDHEHEFVQVGAYAVLNSYMHAHGLKRHARQSESERLRTMEELKAILER